MKFSDGFELLATAPKGVAQLRELILAMAAQGKLVPQDGNDEPACKLLARIDREKIRLVTAGQIRRDKPLPEIGEDEKAFKLPSGWEWVRLASILPFRIGRTPPTKDSRYWASTGIPWVSISDMEHLGKVASTARTVSRSGAALFGYEPLPVGTLLMSFKLTIGKIAVLEVPAYHNEAIASFLPLGGISAEFLKYILPLVAATGSAKDALMGATLNSDSLARLVIALPPIAEQYRIAARVSELMRLCDQLESHGRLEAEQHARLTATLFEALAASESAHALAENWSRVAAHFDLLLDRTEAVEALEQTIVQLAVRGLLVPQIPGEESASDLLQDIRREKDRLIAIGKIRRDKPLPKIDEDDLSFEVPDGWTWTRLGAAVLDSEAGWSPSCENTPRAPGNWGVLKVSAVSWGQFRPHENKTLPAHLAPKPEYEVQPGDFLLSRANTEELVARSVLVDVHEPMLMMSDKLIRLRLSTLINPQYLNLFNNSRVARPYYAAHASGTSSSMKNVSREVVLNLPVAMPPAAEQDRIVTRVAELRQLCTDLRTRLTQRQTCNSHFATALVEQTAAAGPDEGSLELAA